MNIVLKLAIGIKEKYKESIKALSRDSSKTGKRVKKEFNSKYPFVRNPYGHIEIHKENKD